MEQGLVTLALHPLAHQLAYTARRFSGLTGTTLGRLFVGPAVLHLAEYTLTLQLFLKHAERLVDIVISYGYVHGQSHPSVGCMTRQKHLFPQ